MACVAACRFLEELRGGVEEFIRYLKSSTTLPGVDEILVPYESELREKARRSATRIYVEDDTWAGIVRVARELGVKVE